MNCPKCSAKLCPGLVTVHGTLLGFLWYGWSYQHCFWRSDQEPTNEVKIVGSNCFVQAFRCDACELTVVMEKQEGV
jgi:hypothetical protein